MSEEHKTGLRFKEARQGTIARAVTKPSQQPPAEISVRPERRKDAEEEKPENPLLTKIKLALAQSDPDKWEHAGSELKPTAKYTKPYETWETAFHMNLPNGVLVIRCSLPVRSEYFGAGYTVTPTGKPVYYVELRARGWDPRTLIDPYFRVTLDKDKQFTVLADGEIAESVHRLVTDTLRSFSGARKRDFNEQVASLIDSMLDRATVTGADDWKKSEPEPGVTKFSSVLDGINVDVTKTMADDNAAFRLTFHRDEMSSKTIDTGLAKSLFELVDEKLRNASLLALSKVLEGAGF